MKATIAGAVIADTPDSDLISIDGDYYPHLGQSRRMPSAMVARQHHQLWRRR
jgi:hypothetical protein